MSKAKKQDLTMDRAIKNLTQLNRQLSAIGPELAEAARLMREIDLDNAQIRAQIEKLGQKIEHAAEDVSFIAGKIGSILTIGHAGNWRIMAEANGVILPEGDTDDSH